MRVPYQPGNRDTGVLTYELVPGGIILEFRSGVRYLYTAERPGPEHLATMTRLAEAGRGLTTYVAQHVGELYSKKLST